MFTSAYRFTISSVEFHVVKEWVDPSSPDLNPPLDCHIDGGNAGVLSQAATEAKTV